MCVHKYYDGNVDIGHTAKVCRMKSNATMYRLAKLAAIRAGPREVNGKAVAFYLNDEEMQSLFTRAGFNTWSSTTWMQRVGSWPDAFGDVIKFGLAGIIVVVCDTESKLKLEKAAKAHGFDKILGVSRLIQGECCRE